MVHLSRIVIPKADKDSSIYTSPPPRNNRYVLDAMSDDDEDEPPAAPTHTVLIGHVLSRGTQLYGIFQPCYFGQISNGQFLKLKCH